ncbi:MAG: hypothetical protein ACKPBD_15950 [Dolichospermum sp.]
MAEITKTREIIDIILNNHENEPLFIEKVLFFQNSIYSTYRCYEVQSHPTPNPLPALREGA